jgi:hypothetical protein
VAHESAIKGYGLITVLALLKAQYRSQLDVLGLKAMLLRAAELAAEQRIGRSFAAVEAAQS